MAVFFRGKAEASSFLAPSLGTLELQQGESHTLNPFTLFLSCLLYFSFSLFSCFKILKPKKISVIFIPVLFISYLAIMFSPKFGMKDVKVASVDVVGKDNIEEFLTFVSKLYTHDKRSIVELTNSYDSALSCLVARLEKRFVNLNPIIHKMFLKLDSMERGNENDFY